MTDIVNTATIRVEADASGVEAGLRPAVDAANRTGAAIAQVGTGAGAAAAKVEAAQRNIIASIQRTTTAMEAGGKSTAAYYEAIGNQRGVDPSVLAPYLAQLRAVEEAQARAAQAAAAQQIAQQAAQQQATESARAQAAAQRELAQAQASRDSFLAGLREQVTLFGASTEEVLRYRAAQLGATHDAEALIAQLQAMRAAQEQANQAARDSAEAARAEAAAQRELAQAQAARDSFVAGLRDQVALYGQSTEEVLRYRAAQAGASGEAEQLIAQLQAMRVAQEQVTQAARAQAEAERAAAQAQSGRDSFVESLRQQADAIGRTRTELLELRAAQLGVTNDAAPFIARLREADSGLSHTGMSAAQTAAALRQVPAQLTDIIVGLQGGQAPLTVLFQQGGQLRDMFGSVGGAARALGGAVLNLINPYTLAAAAAAALAYAFKVGHDESIEYGRAIALSGNLAGTTTGQMGDMARSIGLVTGSQHEAAAAMVALVSTSAVANSNLQRFGTVAVQAQQVLGKSVADTVAEFAQLGRSPLSALQQIDEKYHFITASTYAQVKAAQEQGRTIEAANIAQQAYADGIDKQRQKVLDSLSDWERGWIRIKNATSGAADAVIDFASGREATNQQKINSLLEDREAIETRLAQLKKQGQARDGSSYDPSRDANVLAAEAELDANKRSINVIRDKAKSSQDAAAATSAAAKADELRKKWIDDQNVLLTRQDMLKRDLAAADTEGRAAGLSEKEIQDRLLVVRRQYNDVYEQGIETSITALNRRAELENQITQRALAQVQTQQGLGNISDGDAINQAATIELAALDRQKKVLQDQLGLIRTKINSQQEQADLEGQIATLGEQRRTREMQQQNDLLLLQEKRRQSSEDLFTQGGLSATAEQDSLIAALGVQLDYNASIGLNKTEQADLTARRLESTAALKEQTAAEFAAMDGGAAMAKKYREQAQTLRDTAAATRVGAQLEIANSQDLDNLRGMVDIMSALDQAAQKAAQGMTSAFGSVGTAIGGMTTALTGYQSTQAAIAAQLASATKDAGGDQTKIQRANQLAMEQSAQAQVQSYGDMAAAAKGFFGENTAGYRALEGVEKTYRAFEMAMAVQTMLQKTGLLTTYPTAVVAGKETETAATVASVGPDVAASMAKGQAAAVAGVAGQAQGDPYTAWFRMAAMAAAMAALGFAVSGGGGSDTTAADRQAAQGTGTVLGSSSAKSDSLNKAVELTAENSSTQINYLAALNTTLKLIQSNITAFASQLVQSGVVDGSANGNLNLNTNNGTASTVGMIGTGAAIGSYFGPIGTAVGAVIGAIAQKIPVIGNLFTGIFGGKQTLSDSGFTIQNTSVGSALANGVQGVSYADIHTSGGLFSSSKDKTQTTALGADANQQFSSIIESLATSITQAGSLLGLSGDAFTNQLNSFVIDIGKVSLKDMSSDDIEKTLESVFSKLGDQMAQSAIPNLQQFQQVGEGYLETLVRVASDYAKVDASLQSIGITFGSVGVASIGARESLISLTGGIDEFQSKTADFASNFLTKEQQLAPVQAFVTQQLESMNLGWIKTREDFAAEIASLSGHLDDAGAQQTYAALMNLEAAFAAVTPEIVDTTKSLQDIADERKDLQDQLDELTMTSAQLLAKQRDALDDSNKALFDQVQAAQKVKDAQDAAKTSLGNFITQMKSFATTAAGLNNSLALGDLSTLTPEQQYDEARRQFEQTRQAAAAGDTTAQGNLSSIEQAFLQISQKLNGGDSQYSADLATVMHTNDQLADWATSSADVAQSSLDALNDSNATLTDISATLAAIAQGVQYLPAALSGQDTTSYSQAFAAIDYSAMGTSDMNALVDEIKALRDEVKGLRAEALKRTADAIQAASEAAQQAAETVVDGVHDAVTDASWAANKSTRAIK